MTSQRVGNGPSYISGADLNNDHKIDLVTANYDDSTISVLLGNGDNTFQNQVKYSTGTTNDNPNALYIADVNKDGNLDVVTANSGTSNVAVFLGKGDGTFSTAKIYSTGTGCKPTGLVLGDLNKDGNNDLVVTDETNNVVLIFLGDGTGAFTLTNTLSSDSNSKPYGVTINDFNGDGLPDIGITNSGTNNVGIFLNNGNTIFKPQTTYSTGNNPVAMTVVDFNKDGILDIATANYAGNSISVLLGNSAGTFQAQKLFSTGSGSLPYSIYSGDFNGDKNQDIIVPDSGTNKITIFRGNGHGNFRSQKTYSTGDGSNPVDITAVDLNNDNRLDFASANYGTNTVSVFLNTCN
ncbi:unnamed protein product [Adineta steineri]|uniref:VCBS repeat-containing protein n=1 Tax=Adineta steineri TaxID=433720 RepID=A0A814ARJ0_9BILA|nr:unnamed protein product [Adineta steineri]CAF0982266.1 unnamed protein product [Adineta steineri]